MPIDYVSINVATYIGGMDASRLNDLVAQGVICEPLLRSGEPASLAPLAAALAATLTDDDELSPTARRRVIQECTQRVLARPDADVLLSLRGAFETGLWVVKLRIGDVSIEAEVNAAWWRMQLLRRAEASFVVDRDVMGGLPVIPGTRIPALFVARDAVGASFEQLRETYPILTHRLLEDAMTYNLVFPTEPRRTTYAGEALSVRRLHLAYQSVRGQVNPGLGELVSAEELAARLGLGDAEQVVQSEGANRLFSVRRPDVTSQRLYPAFQAWPRIAGEPLAAVLSILGSLGGAATLSFLSSPCHELGGLTPVEALIGVWLPADPPPQAAQPLLLAQDAERMQAVLASASAFAGDLLSG